jgi:hypothetical protein
MSSPCPLTAIPFRSIGFFPGNKTGYTETAWFTPLPPDAPVYVGPGNATKQSLTGVKLTWKPGYWAHKADVYFGTSSNPPLVARDVTVTPKSTASYSLPAALGRPNLPLEDRQQDDGEQDQVGRDLAIRVDFRFSFAYRIASSFSKEK